MTIAMSWALGRFAFNTNDGENDSRETAGAGPPFDGLIDADRRARLRPLHSCAIFPAKLTLAGCVQTAFAWKSEQIAGN